MTDEQAAAERLRKLQSSDLFAVDYDNDKRAVATRGIGVTWNIWRECKTVIRAYLAEHPADDAVALDEAFLRACGFEEGTATHGIRNWRVVSKTGLIRVECYNSQRWRVEVIAYRGDSCKLRDPTCGRLRGVASALGIPLPPENVK